MKSRLDIRLAYHSDTGKYPIVGSVDSLTIDLEADQEINIEDDDYVENPLFPLLDYIEWLEEKLGKSTEI